MGGLMAAGEYWNAVAGEKQFTAPVSLDLISARVPFDAAVCELGCGYGRVLQALWDAGYRQLYGVSTSPRG